MWKRLLTWLGKWLLKEAIEEVQEKVSDAPVGARSTARKPYGKAVK